MGMQDLKKIQSGDNTNSTIKPQNNIKKVSPIKKTTEPGNNQPVNTVGFRHRRGNKPRFEDTHVRFTNYLRKDISERIERLRDEGKIESITKLINDAIRKHLDTYY
jgi:hypothetical protein